MLKKIIKIIISGIIVYPLIALGLYLEHSWYGKFTWIVILVLEIIIAGVLIFVEIKNDKNQKGK